MDLNKVMLLGNLTKDPQLRTTTGGQSVASFGMATNRKWKDRNTGELKEEAQFHNLVAWGKTGEIISQYVKKGEKLFVEGRLQTRSWDDQQTGQKRYTTEIVVDNIILLGRRGDGSSASYAQTQPAASAAPRPQTPQQNNNINIPAPEQIPTINIDEGQEEIKVEDIPF